MRLSVLLLLAFLLYPVKGWSLLDTTQVSGLNDITLPTWNIGDPSISASIDMCIYSISILGSPDYSVSISSPGGYFLKSGVQQIPYSLYWEDSGSGNLGSNSGTQLTNGIALAHRNNAHMLSTTCAALPAGPTARLYIKITQADMNAALAGTYTGTITILISAN